MHSDRYKFIYLNAPKTASRSMRDALTRLTDGEAVIPDGIHASLKDYATGGVLQAPLDEYFIFTFTRNPWARHVSGYFYQSRHPDQARVKENNWTFSEYCRHKTMKFQYNGLRYHTPPPRFSFVGRVENLQHDFDALCDKLGLERMKMPHLNATRHHHWREYYDDESRDIIAEKYARDIEIFGYTFDD